MKGIAVLVLVSACDFSAHLGNEQPNVGDADIDAYMLDAYVPDGPSSCPTTTPPTCVPMSNILRECKTVGSPATDTTCPWGCFTNTTPHHCGKIVPSGGAVMQTDLDPNPSLQDKTLSNNTITFDTVNGTISNNIRGSGMGIQNGIDFQVRNGVGIFRFNKLKIDTNVRAIGANSLALVSITTVDVNRTIDVRGDCSNTNAGPGGRPGGATGTAGMPATGGGGAGPSLNGNDAGGGGGGGYGATGGKGGIRTGDTAASGGSVITQNFTTLFGGSGGGGGGGPLGGVGGGGGGAIQIVSNGATKISGQFLIFYAGINAGGCGGKPGASGDAGGGGGSGGAVLIEASTITLNYAGVSVNGGGGGGADTGQPGQNGQLDTSRASGGAGANGAGAGGLGGASGSSSHGGTQPADNDNAGGGGGGVGWIRMNTVSGGVSMQNLSFSSPSFNDGNTTATRGMPTIQ